MLSRTQAGPGRKVTQEQEDISHNHVQAFSGASVLCLAFGALLDVTLKKVMSGPRTLSHKPTQGEGSSRCTDFAIEEAFSGAFGGTGAKKHESFISE